MIGKLLGIDHGLKRIGVAVSDALGYSARELAIIKRTTNEADFKRLNQIAFEQNVIAVVIGLPLNPDAAQENQAKIVRNWAQRFSKSNAFPIIFWDEQLSSADAREIARDLRRKPGDPIDDLAARVILQSYLDAVRDGLTEPPLTGQ
jgi:putative holliday junction resolvase